ncbi:MAG: hypothetical protein LBK53_07870 [Heliobacteriaceae bacterium]|jgi:hypothetical protein|nr:hypothetical protein [Heliobacteriaceae bacterium]
MSKRDNILLISDNSDLAGELAAKIILLRKSDNVTISDYSEDKYAGIVLLHENQDRTKTIELIKKHKEKNASILLVMDSVDPKFILEAYDAGISDFCLSGAADYEIVIKIINCIKMLSVSLNAARYADLLTGMGIIDEDSGFYSYKSRKDVFEKEIKNGGVFAALTGKGNMNAAVKLSVRSDDIAAHGKGAQYFLMLPGTDVEGARKVVDKIRGHCHHLKAGVVNISGHPCSEQLYSELEQEALLALASASDDNYFIVQSQSEPLDKQYKIFKKVFDKKLEKVITPVFYRMQKQYESSGIKILQFAEDKKSVFQIKTERQNSKLEIVYSGFTKVLIRITHEGLDSPENSETEIPLPKLNQKFLEDTIEGLVNR